jgi:hypothetical protein
MERMFTAVYSEKNKTYRFLITARGTRGDENYPEKAGEMCKIFEIMEQIMKD